MKITFCAAFACFISFANAQDPTIRILKNETVQPVPKTVPDIRSLIGIGILLKPGT